MAAGKATLLISCIDRPGIIARVATHLFTLGCNIITSDQYSDDEDGHFFWRIHFESLRLPVSELSKELDASMPSLLPWERLKCDLFDAARRDRIVIMVSRLPHCMMDLLSLPPSTTSGGTASPDTGRRPLPGRSCATGGV